MCCDLGVSVISSRSSQSRYATERALDTDETRLRELDRAHSHSRERPRSDLHLGHVGSASMA